MDDNFGHFRWVAHVVIASIVPPSMSTIVIFGRSCVDRVGHGVDLFTSWILRWPVVQELFFPVIGLLEILAKHRQTDGIDHVRPHARLW